MGYVLIVDDDELIGHQLSRTVEQMGCTPFWVQTLAHGEREVLRGVYDVVLLDVSLPDGNGLEALPRWVELPAAPEVVIITSAEGGRAAEQAITSGAWDYIRKPVDLAELRLTVLRALTYKASKTARRSSAAFGRDAIIGTSPRLLACIERAAEAASGDAAVLLLGATGTGKELFARAIHDNSARANGPFVTVDCAALPPTLVESTLFGHARGAFTGAQESREGLVAQADGGTLFLDEVGDLPIDVQRLFLRVLQERRFLPVGADLERRSDFRLIAATNQDMDALVSAGRFRADVLFRIQGFVLALPPLTEREGDIEDLAVHWCAEFCRRAGVDVKGLSRAFIACLSAYHWPGNVRELVQTVERAVSAAYDAPQLRPQHLPRPLRAAVAGRMHGAEQENGGQHVAERGALPLFAEFRREIVARGEKDYLRMLVDEAQGSLERALALSGLSKTRLYELLRAHGLRLRP
jgi:two-component system NtrC family response regulator